METAYAQLGQNYASRANTYNQDACVAGGPSQFSLIEERFAQLIQGLAHEGEALQSLCDRVFGAELSKESGGAVPRPVPNGKVALFNAALDEAHQRLARVSNLIGRLSQAI